MVVKNKNNTTKGGGIMNDIKNLRENKGLSQENVANKLNVKQQAVAKWEAGKSYPRTDKLPQLAKIFGCTIDDLFKKGE